MDLELRLREAVREEDPGEMFTARVMAGVDGAKVVDIRTRMRPMIILTAALLVICAAAAMLGAGPPDRETSRSEQVAQQPVIAEPSRVNEEVAAVASPRSKGQVSTDRMPDSVPPTDAPRRIVLRVMPIADRSGAPGARMAAEAFRAELVRDFRGMRDLLVLDFTDDSEAQADFRLTVSSLEWKRSAPGMVEVISTTGTTSSSGSPYRSEDDPQNMPELGTLYWPVEAKIEEARAPDSSSDVRRNVTILPFSGINGIRRPETPCSISGSLPYSIQWLGQTCGNKTAIASGLAEVMRQRNVPVAITPQPAALAANAAITPRPGFYRKPLSENLRIFFMLTSLADSVERAAQDGKPADDIRSQSITLRFDLDDFDLDDKELAKLDKYLRFAVRSDRDNQAMLQKGICARITEFHTLDQFGAALNEYLRKTDAHQETLGHVAETELWPVLFSKISIRNLEQTRREENAYDFPAMFQAQQRDLQQELDRFCSYGK